MPDDASDLILRLHREEIERMRNEPPDTRRVALAEPSVSQSLELPDAGPDCPIVAEWDLYRHEVGRLLELGQRGRFSLVKAGHAITVWDTLHDAVQAAQLLFGQEPCLVQEIQPFVRPLPMFSRDAQRSAPL